MQSICHPWFWPLILGSDLTPQRFKSSHILFFMTCFSLQIITFRDYLPIVLGSEMQKWIPPYQGYNNSVDPRISNVFTFAFLFGHLEFPSTVSHLDENYQPWGLEAQLPLHTLFFNTWRIIKDGMSFRGQVSPGCLTLQPASRKTWRGSQTSATSYVTLGKWLYLTEPQFLRL